MSPSTLKTDLPHFGLFCLLVLHCSGRDQGAHESPFLDYIVGAALSMFVQLREGMLEPEIALEAV